MYKEYNQCRDHGFIPKGLIIKDPIGSSELSKTLQYASLTLVKQQLKQFRTCFAKEKNAYDSTMATLKNLLGTSHFSKLSELNMASSRTYHNKHLKKHQQKFRDLISRYQVPFINPYDNLSSFDISHPTFSGLFKNSVPVVKPCSNAITNAVVSLTNQPLEEEETKLMALGLKFSPSMEKSLVVETSSGLEPTLKKLDPAVESAVTYDVANCLTNSKHRKSNLSGNAAVVMSNEQYKSKVEEHLGMDTYSLLKKDPTESLSRKLDVILKKLHKEKKISKQFYDNSRVLHPRSPQIYGLPKIHKPGNPLLPIVSFYQHSTSSCPLFSNRLRSLDYALLILKISSISLDRTTIQNRIITAP